ncbi:MAG: hypothetical protein N2662_04255, partial [Bacteroidales bacterium]|nr:hypothetical protein [Bacteroidales bacterium]
MKIFAKVFIGTLVLWGSTIIAYTQKISYCEYFIDIDPGFGKGISIPITSDSAISVSTQISLPELNLGAHRLTLRCRDIIGRWSFQQTQTFTLYSSEPKQTQIVAGEYWIGDDPGQGKGLPLLISPDTAVNLQFNVSPLYDIGTISVRFRNNLGQWGLIQGRTFKTIISPSQDSLSMFAIYLDDTLHVDNPVQKKIIAPATAFNDTLRIKLSPSAGE